MNDPYNRFIDVMREEGKFFNQPLFFIAEITKRLPDIELKFNDVELDKYSLMIDKWLLDRATETFIYYDDEGGNKHEMREPLTHILDIGDNVVLLRNGEKFIIISKVVNL